jgi:Tol biopolymer transport system component
VGLAAVAVVVGKLLVGGSDGSGGTKRAPEDGTTFVTVSSSSEIAVLDLASGHTRIVTRANGRYLAVSSPTWAPDGRRIAFAQQKCAHCPYRTAVVSTAGGSAELLRGWPYDANEPAWSPAGGRIAFTTSHEGDRELALFSLREGRGRALELHEEPSGAASEEEVEAANHPVFSPNGRLLAFDAETTRERTKIFVLDLASRKLREIENEADHNASPGFSPDGQRLTFAQIDARYAWDVCVVRLARADQVCLTRSSANDVDPSWSPDGRSIIFASDRDDPHHLIRSLYIMGADGRGVRRLTTGFDDGAPAFSADGTQVAFVRRRIVRVRQ